MTTTELISLLERSIVDHGNAEVIVHCRNSEAAGPIDGAKPLKSAADLPYVGGYDLGEEFKTFPIIQIESPA